MDQQTPLDNILLQHPGHLIIGHDTHTVPYVHQSLQTVLCPQQGCTKCILCKQIISHQHHAIRWLVPEKSYTREDLDIVFDTIGFALDANNHMFFVIQKADLLNTSSANSLLKSLEEPAAGYHFIFLAQSLDLILPTLRSRCIINQLPYASVASTQKQLMHYFSQGPLPQPADFLKTIEQSKITEHETVELINTLCDYWNHQYKHALQSAQSPKKAYNTLMILHTMLKKPPMPGSSKLFWKNLFLQFIRN